MHQNNITPESLPADLAQIVKAWSNLPKNIKVTIKTLVNLAHKKKEKMG
jgi:hypothetical protein